MPLAETSPLPSWKKSTNNYHFTAFLRASLHFLKQRWLSGIAEGWVVVKWEEAAADRAIAFSDVPRQLQSLGVALPSRRLPKAVGTLSLTPPNNVGRGIHGLKDVGIARLCGLLAPVLGSGRAVTPRAGGGSFVLCFSCHIQLWKVSPVITALVLLSGVAPRAAAKPSPARWSEPGALELSQLTMQHL